MAETTASSPHAPYTEQAATSIEAKYDLDTPPIAGDETNPPVSDNSETPGEPLEPVESAVPPDQPNRLGQPAPGEEELDELIIEDFTIDGICGVY
jgi:mycofactocin precursor